MHCKGCALREAHGRYLTSLRRELDNISGSSLRVLDMTTQPLHGTVRPGTGPITFQTNTGTTPPVCLAREQSKSIRLTRESEASRDGRLLVSYGLWFRAPPTRPEAHAQGSKGAVTDDGLHSLCTCLTGHGASCYPQAMHSLHLPYGAISATPTSVIEARLANQERAYRWNKRSSRLFAADFFCTPIICISNLTWLETLEVHGHVRTCNRNNVNLKVGGCLVWVLKAIIHAPSAHEQQLRIRAIMSCPSRTPILRRGRAMGAKRGITVKHQLQRSGTAVP